MNRDQLLELADAFVDFINTPGADPNHLKTTTDETCVVPIPYPGSTPDFDGLVATTEKIHGASPDFKMGFLEAMVDEKESTVVLLLNPHGTQEGYVHCDSLTVVSGLGSHPRVKNSILWDFVNLR